LAAWTEPTASSPQERTGAPSWLAPPTGRSLVYPVVLRLEGRRCLVVGGGKVARRKVEGLLAAGAVVTVVAPRVDPAIDAVPEVAVERRPYRSEDVAGCWLVFAATDDPGVQQAVFDDGQRAGIWVNAADDPERCAFFLPAILRREPVVLAVSTEGRSPALAAWLRDRAAAMLPDQLEHVAAQLVAERDELRANGIPTEGRDWGARIEQLLAQYSDDHPAAGPST
jgi:siroheme synthase-like protein